MIAHKLTDLEESVCQNVYRHDADKREKTLHHWESMRQAYLRNDPRVISQVKAMVAAENKPWTEADEWTETQLHEAATYAALHGRVRNLMRGAA